MVEAAEYRAIDAMDMCLAPNFVAPQVPIPDNFIGNCNANLLLADRVGKGKSSNIFKGFFTDPKRSWYGQRNTVSASMKKAPVCLDVNLSGMRMLLEHHQDQLEENDDEIGHAYAVKIMHKSKVLNTKKEKRVVKEVEMSMLFCDKFILEILGTFQTIDHFGYITELGCSTLFDFLLQSNERTEEPASAAAAAAIMDEESVKHITAQLILGMDHVHQMGIAIRGLSTRGIYVMYNGNVKIADFSFAEYVDPSGLVPPPPMTKEQKGSKAVFYSIYF